MERFTIDKGDVHFRKMCTQLEVLLVHIVMRNIHRYDPCMRETTWISENTALCFDFFEQTRKEDPSRLIGWCNLLGRRNLQYGDVSDLLVAWDAYTTSHPTITRKSNHQSLGCP
jgi:hypothetical protein